MVRLLTRLEIQSRLRVHLQVGVNNLPPCPLLFSPPHSYPPPISALFHPPLPPSLSLRVIGLVSSLSYTTSRSGELRTQKLQSHLMRTQSLKVLTLKPGIGQYIAMYATITARDFFLANVYPSGPFICIFPKPLPSFSCVGCG